MDPSDNYEVTILVILNYDGCLREVKGSFGNANRLLITPARPMRAVRRLPLGLLLGGHSSFGDLPPLSLSVLPSEFASILDAFLAATGSCCDLLAAATVEG